MKNHQQERNDTDESLRSERSKTDTELEAARAAIDDDADQVVELARARAEGVLSAARERTDRDLVSGGGHSDVAQQLEAERVDEDRAVAKERATADECLQEEREARRRLLSSLLDAEREATDERLLIERARADHTVSTRDEFLGMVSHDLRGLLGGLATGGAQLTKHAIRQGEAGAELLRQADRMQRLTSRMTRLVGDLLDVVSLEAGQLAVTPQPLQVEQLMEEALEAFQPAFVAKGLTLTSRVLPGAAQATFDHDRILQVLANLLGNALKFTTAGGRVSMTVSPCDTGICFSIIDDGIGIPADELTFVFERFRQVKANDKRGLGLGLYIARSIVEAHGGRIWAECAAQGGAALHFTLPVKPHEET